MAEQEKRQIPQAKPTPLARFPKAAHLEATAICARQADWLEGRREVAGITIDGPASKDLDDAFWLERDPSTGGYLLFVSIADVGACITPALTPALDTAARARAFTRYGARSLTPMLPRLLSEERLSLLAGAVRPTITIRLPLDSALRVGELVIELTALRSRKRWTSEEVDAEIADPQTEFGAMLRLAWHLAEQLLKRRRTAGALALYDLASGWATTEEGALVQLPPSRRHKAHIIVQELMILVNQHLAEYLAERGILALYRNHTARATAPERETLREMIETALTHPERGAPQRVQKTMMLTLERARYAPIVAGHFGLNLPAYLHATSPLRRYPDLVNQRILHAVLAGDPPPYTSEELAALAAQINTEEDRLRDARQRLFLAAYDEPLRALLAHASRSAAGQGEDAAEDDAQEAQRSAEKGQRSKRSRRSKRTKRTRSRSSRWQRLMRNAFIASCAWWHRGKPVRCNLPSSRRSCAAWLRAGLARMIFSRCCIAFPQVARPGAASNAPRSPGWLSMPITPAVCW